MDPPILLLPRMPGHAVDDALELMRQSGIEGTKRPSISALPVSVSYAPVGGTPIGAEQLDALRKEIESIAASVGYPSDHSAAAKAKFDALCAQHLADAAILANGDALRDDTWAFISSCLLRHLSVWRFGLAPARFHGGVRNTFQRLWLRARALDRGLGTPQRWELIDNLTEDAFVGIVERPAIAGNAALALAVGEGWLRASRIYGRSAMQEVMRRAIIGIRLRNEILMIAHLPETKKIVAIDSAFLAAASSLGLRSGK